MFQRYESMIILNPNLSEEESTKENEKLLDFLKEHGGEIIKTDPMGKRRLAFEIQKKKEGYYFVNYFQFDNQQTKEIERYYKLNDDIIRYNMIRLDK